MVLLRADHVRSIQHGPRGPDTLHECEPATALGLRSRKKTTEPNRAPRLLFVGQTLLLSVVCGEPDLYYAVNEVPQPQLPVAFGFVNVKPEPITPVT